MLENPSKSFNLINKSVSKVKIDQREGRKFLNNQNKKFKKQQFILLNLFLSKFFIYQ